MRHYFDGDSECDAEIFQELANLLGIKKLQTSGYNIKGNGLSEKLLLLSSRLVENYEFHLISNNRFFSMKELKEKLSKMFNIANESVNALK